jgi:hypothetical protein
MSYLDRPRLVFSGVFIADPSTVNNDPLNYDAARLQKDPGWNPNGTGQWKFQGCAVTAALYADGTAATQAADDPIVGANLLGNPKGSPAKIVDLDSEQQMVSQIWGFTVQLAAASGAALVTGRFEVAAFTDIWFRAVDAGSGGDAPMGAAYQSVLTPLAWGDVAGSRFLRELREASPEKLSIKFNLDGINMQAGTPTFTQGRVVGAIGPAGAGAGEPDHFIAGRLLRSAPGAAADPQPVVLQGTPPASTAFFAPAKVDRGRGVVRLDLGNSLSTTTPGGPLNPALGDLRLAALPAGEPPVLLGAVSYQAMGWYTTTAGIVELPLTASQLEQLAEAPLALIQLGAGGEPTVLLRENPQGAFIRAESFVFRLNPGESAEVELRATRFGRPAAGQTIALKLAPEYVDQIQSPPNPPSIPIGEPASALAFPERVTTDADGRAVFTLAAADPGNPRRFIDGQVYGIVYLWGDEEPADYWHDPTSFLSVLAFDGVPPIDHPTWRDVQPILAQYAALYPFMTTKIVDLGSYAAVKQNLASIEKVLSLPKEDPAYMQVTRDMSRDRLALVLRWIAQGAPE